METVGLGFHFEDLPVGRKFKTVGRTIMEADITNFINCTGLTEVFFMNLEVLRTESVFDRRFAPAALCYCFCEALLAQATLQHTGLAMLHLELDIKGPVFVGDTIHVECEVLEARRSKTKPDRGIIRTVNRIVKQDGTVAYIYYPTRMIRTRPAAGTDARS
jgi:acyl dehydratase